jgi:hypothetical protein
LVVGAAPATQQLIEWLHRGPPSARVTQVDVVEVSLDELDEVPIGFATR